jgi:phospholipid/cholesterol/gamma-HCH transport system substrate-binding protein
MNALDLDKTLSKANNALDATPELMEKLKGTLAEADKAAQELTGLMTQVSNGEGTVGKLLSDDQLYTDLEKAMQNLDLLLEDFRLHPERYRRILSKKKMPYEAPNR